MKRTRGRDTRQLQKKNAPRTYIYPLVIAIIYACMGSMWILGSDRIVAWLYPDSTTIVFLQTGKGILYILITTLLVYLLAYRAAKRMKKSLVETQLEESENLLKTVMANLGEAVIIVDPTTRTIQQCNSAVTTLFGYTVDEMQGQSTRILYPDEETYTAMGRLSRETLEEHGVYRSQHIMVQKDGSHIDVEFTIIALYQARGWQSGMVGIVRDITSRVRAENAVRESEKRYRVLAENTHEVIWAIDTSYRFSYVNPAVTRMLGYTPEEFIGTMAYEHCTEDVYRQLIEIVEAEVKKGREHKGFVLETECVRRDGTTLPVEVHGSIVFDDEEKPVGVQGTLIDISERLALEAQVRQSQKLEAIGTLAGGVAHEINNPIMAVEGFAGLIQKHADDSEKVWEYSREITRETEQIHSLIKNLLGYARTDKQVRPEKESLSEIVDSTVSLIRAVMRHDTVSLSIELAESLPMIECYRQAIQQVIMNLLTNARDAVNSSDTTRENKKVVLSAHRFLRNDDAWIRISVEDTGPGIPDDVRERMFSPFYSTKPAGQGTGLGLWIVYNIVSDHGGRIHVEHRDGGGTCFHVELPVANSEIMPVRPYRYPTGGLHKKGDQGRG